LAPNPPDPVGVHTGAATRLVDPADTAANAADVADVAAWAGERAKLTRGSDSKVDPEALGAAFPWQVSHLLLVPVLMLVLGDEVHLRVSSSLG